MSNILSKFGAKVYRPKVHKLEKFYSSPHWQTTGNNSYNARDLNLVVGDYLIESPSQHASDLYANRFYDKGNAGYYLDPASTSYLNDVRANIYYERENTAYYFGSSQGDFRMRNGRFDSVDAYGTFDMQSGNQIRLYTSSGNIRGYIQSTDIK